MLVEHTQKCIVLPTKEIGAEVNIEVDVMAKYAESAVGALERRLEALESKLAALEKK